MHITIIIVQAAAVVAGLMAACLWFQSARIEMPSDASVSGYVYEGHPDLQVSGIDEMAEAIGRQGTWNKWAAIATGVSVALQAVAMLLQVLN